VKFRLATEDPVYAAAALLALLGRRKEGDEDLEEVGALLVADFLATIRGLFGKGRK
jgi:hypothetical protein